MIHFASVSCPLVLTRIYRYACSSFLFLIIIITTFWIMCAVPNIAVFAVLDFLLSSYVAQVYPEWLNMVPLAPVVTGIALFCTPQTLHFCCKILYFELFSILFFITFLSSESTKYVSTCFLFFFIITDYNVRFVARKVSISFRLFIAYHG